MSDNEIKPCGLCGRPIHPGDRRWYDELRSSSICEACMFPDPPPERIRDRRRLTADAESWARVAESAARRGDHDAEQDALDIRRRVLEEQARLLAEEENHD